MTLGTTSPSADMAAASTFSYAQAAKGQGTTPSNQESSGAVAPDQASQSQSTSSKDPVASEATVETADSSVDAGARPNGADKQDRDSVQDVTESIESEAVSERRSEPKKDEEVSRLERPWRRNEKSTRTSSTMTRSTDEQESRKPRRGKKNKGNDKASGETASDSNKESAPEPEPKIELAEAPIPSVNIWQQRKEAHLAKVVPGTTTSGPDAKTAAGESKTQSTSTQETAKPHVSVAEAGAVQEPASVNGVKPAKKHAEGSRPERNGSRGSRVAERAVRDGKAEVPPPVQDAQSWPTPETAIQDQKKPADKTERTDKDSQDDGSSSKRSKDKWVHLPFIASASFQTPLPQMRNSKPRGNPRVANGPRSTGGHQPAEKAPSTTGTQPAKSSEARDRARDAPNGINGASTSSNGKRTSIDASNAAVPKKPVAQVNAEKAKEPTAGHPMEQMQSHPKERPEGRGERTRGGFRGRGGHQSVGSHSQHQHSASSMTAPGFQSGGSMGARGGHRTYSPPRQGAHGQMFIGPPQRGGRGGRNGAGSNYHRLSLPVGRFPPVHQQSYGSYDMQMPQAAAMPFQQPQYFDSVVFGMLRSQIEYYFSIENLCKDMFLRKRMDSQGFVPLHFIAAFKRVRDLSGEAGTSMVRAACEESNEIDYVVGEDDMERLRRREGWEQWLVRWEDRDEGARNNGPMHLNFKSRSYQYPPQFNGMPPMSYGVTSPHGYTPEEQQQQQQFSQFVGEPQQGYLPNGVNSSHGHVNGSSKQLSANVPDFSPTGSLGNAQQFKPVAAQEGQSTTGSSEGNGMPNGVHSDGESAPANAQS